MSIFWLYNQAKNYNTFTFKFFNKAIEFYNTDSSKNIHVFCNKLANFVQHDKEYFYNMFLNLVIWDMLIADDNCWYINEEVIRKMHTNLILNPFFMPLNVFLHLIDKIRTIDDTTTTTTTKFINNISICLDKNKTADDLEQFIYKFTFTFLKICNSQQQQENIHFN